MWMSFKGSNERSSTRSVGMNLARRFNAGVWDQVIVVLVA